MMYLCTTAFILVTVFCTAQLEATELTRLTPSQAVDRALAVHPDVSLAGLRVEAARGDRRAAGQLPNPTVTYGFESLDRAGADAGEWALDASWSVDGLWRRGPRVRVAEADVTAAMADDQQVRSAMRLRVLTAYTQAFAAAGQARILSEAGRMVREVVRIGQERQREGDLSEYDVRRMTLESSRLLRMTQQAHLSEADARHRLALYVGADPDSLQRSHLEATYPLALPTHSTASLIDLALMRRPDLQGSVAARDAGRAEVARLERKRWPSVQAGLGYKDEKRAASGLTGRLSIDVPLFDRAQGELQRARALHRHAALEAEWTRTRVEREVVALHARLTALRQQFEGLHTENSLKDLLAIARQRYDEGDGDLITLIDAVSSLTTESQQRWSLLQQYQTTYYELERAVGAPLTEAIQRIETE